MIFDYCNILTILRLYWLFSNTHNGANTSTMIYSIIQSAILHNLAPQKFLTFIFDTIQSSRDASLLVPWSDEIPESCKIKSRRIRMISSSSMTFLLYVYLA